MKTPRQSSNPDSAYGNTLDTRAQELFECLAEDGEYIEWDVCREMIVLRDITALINDMEQIILNRNK